jgi:MFS family permease
MRHIKMTKTTRVVTAASLGAMIQVYNFVIYILISPILAKIFYGNDKLESLMKIYIIFACGYFVRPIGGLLIGKLGRAFGMKSTYLMTIMLMAFSTIFMGSLPSYITLGAVAPYCLLFFRLLQGLAFGGELPASITFVFEHLPEDKKLVGTTFITVGVEFGILLATCVVFLFTNFLTYEELIVWGWRPPFFIGAILAAIGFYLRFVLTDTPDFEEENDVCNKVKRISFFSMMKNYTNEVIVSFMINIGLGVYVSVFCLFMPSILNKMYGFKLAVAYDYNVCFMVVYILSTILAGYLVKDFKFSPRVLFVVGAVLVSIFTFPVILTLSANTLGLTLVSYIMLGCALASCCGMMPFLLASIFTPEARFAGIAISYNIAQAIGSGCTPIIIALIILYGNKQYSIPILILIATLIIICGFLLGILLKGKNGKVVLSKQ